MAAKVKCRTSFVTFWKTKIRKIIGGMGAPPLAPPSRYAPADDSTFAFLRATSFLYKEYLYSLKCLVSLWANICVIINNGPDSESSFSLASGNLGSFLSNLKKLLFCIFTHCGWVVSKSLGFSISFYFFFSYSIFTPEHYQYKYSTTNPTIVIDSLIFPYL